MCWVLTPCTPSSGVNVFLAMKHACSTTADCAGNELCDLGGVCSCSYLYAFASHCMGLTPMSFWVLASRGSTLIACVCCTFMVLRVALSTPRGEKCCLTPSRAALGLVLCAMLCLSVEMVYAIVSGAVPCPRPGTCCRDPVSYRSPAAARRLQVFVAEVGLHKSVDWGLQRGMRNTLEAVAAACGLLAGLMLSLSWINAILGTRQLERVSTARVMRTRIFITVFMAGACTHLPATCCTLMHWLSPPPLPPPQ